MSREEGLIRSTAVAIAATVREVPPLRLPTVTDDLRRVARHPRGTRGARGARRLRGWLVPAAAAAVVLAIALSLVLIRDIPNGRAAPSEMLLLQASRSPGANHQPVSPGSGPLVKGIPSRAALTARSRWHERPGATGCGQSRKSGGRICGRVRRVFPLP